MICGDPSVLFYGNDYVHRSDHRAAAEAALRGLPGRTHPPDFPELLAEGLDPHQVKEVYLSSDPAHVNTRIDISSTIERKIEALRCHKSQVDPGDGQWIRDWADGEAGKAAGMQYAEAFRVIKLVDDKSE